ncbi:hypothetical protein QFZ34_002086 [Phyllobacterium ifriqiyense]|uniref:Uncharacterized protein n=1 Tax=Phyllobacterium ifriqiyense TaxID=314238 RepID=A0ABU0S817_9HYPH|nr:hypothetical protein [Phyllobacterium ifriqiyense]MDQ0996904.1 hypothetical protein [Phyllobacterium ifriqiyense]
MNDNVKTYRLKIWELAVLFALSVSLVGLIIVGLFAGGAKL